MLLSTLSLVTAASALTFPHKQYSNNQKDVFEKCTIIRSPAGDTIYDCPGCVLIIGKDGDLKLRTGEECRKYRDELDDRETVIQNGGCQIIKQPNGDTLSQCPGCQKIVDKHGKTKLEQGPNCRHAKEDVQVLFKQVYDSGFLAIQE
ncbi:MAG: hypothetical protein GOMPHAMPRED_007856 [Gomphillus americanus]|uniref:Uncharacterized protein n=1 Tax=Gomphillus americanus TaxID=1940652 RepID=A0A8H3F006_9LECA|nr:MAG: hypothetical protein GOMPHAMPRED_007856 [Gomphillus americanus]